MAAIVLMTTDSLGHLARLIPAESRSPAAVQGHASLLNGYRCWLRGALVVGPSHRETDALLNPDLAADEAATISNVGSNCMSPNLSGLGYYDTVMQITVRRARLHLCVQSSTLSVEFCGADGSAD
jgi:hypothetical protein